MNCKLYPSVFFLLLVSVLANEVQNQQTSERWSDDDLFLYGMVAGGFVSLIGLIAAFLLLGLKKVISQHFFTVLIQILFAFSCGALLGETMLHILPQAYASRQLKNENVSLTFIIAIIVFIGLERLFQKAGIAHTHWHEEDEEENDHVKQKKQLQAIKGKQIGESKQSTGFLNLISSLIHNFIDGLAIGVAFSLGNPNQFLPVTIGIIAHEIPREMGDVAILLKSRFNQKQTVISNGVVNLISLLGVYLGLNSQTISIKTRQYILVFVAGNFLYIASDIWKNLFHHSRPILNLLELLGLLLGVYLAVGDHHHH